MSESARRVEKALGDRSSALPISAASRREGDEDTKATYRFSVVLETHEWQALYCTLHRTAKPPETPPTLRQAVHWIARLGGFLDRRSDGEPGVKTIWLGLRRLSDIAATWQLAHAYPSPSPACST